MYFVEGMLISIEIIWNKKCEPPFGFFFGEFTPIHNLPFEKNSGFPFTTTWKEKAGPIEHYPDCDIRIYSYTSSMILESEFWSSDFIDIFWNNRISDTSSVRKNWYWEKANRTGKAKSSIMQNIYYNRVETIVQYEESGQSSREKGWKEFILGKVPPITLQYSVSRELGL